MENKKDGQEQTKKNPVIIPRDQGLMYLGHFSFTRSIVGRVFKTNKTNIFDKNMKKP